MTRPRLTLLHGFTQTGRSFEPLLPGLSQHFDVVAPDLPGHGTRSPATLEESVRLLAEDGGRGLWLGYSMGARVALRLALDHPELVDRLVLVSATAGIEDADERASRRRADEVMAAYLEGRAGQDEGPPAYLEGRAGQDEGPPAYLEGRAGQDEGPAAYLEGRAGQDEGPAAYLEGRAGQDEGPPAYLEGRAGQDEGPAADGELAATRDAQRLEAFLQRWLAQPMFAGLSPEAAGLESRRENTAAGLAGALRLLGQGSFEPVWDRLLGLRMPVLVVAGERDDAYCEQALRLGAWLGQNATLAMVPGAGHACHLEVPEAFLDLTLSFLTQGRGPDGTALVAETVE